MIRPLQTVICAALLIGAPAAAAAAGTEGAPAVSKLGVVAERATSATAGKPSATPASVKVDGCANSSVPGSRSYLLSASASSVPGAKSLRVRFHLYAKLPGKPEEEIRISSGNLLGEWESPVAIGTGGIGNVKFTKRIYRLSAPATYRAKVDFEWYSAAGAKGSRVKASAVSARSCVQADLRPDLRFTSTTVEPSGQAKAKVKLVVANTGKGRSAAGYVRLFVPGTGPGSGVFNLELGRIDEQGTRRSATKADPIVTSRTLQVEVARCASGSAMTVEIDPAGTIGERSVEDNFGQIACLTAG